MQSSEAELMQFNDALAKLKVQKSCRIMMQARVKTRRQ